MGRSKRNSTGMNISKKNWWLGGGAAAAEDITTVRPDLSFLNDDTVFYIESASTKTLYKETNYVAGTDADGVPLNIASVDDDNVGTIYDLSNNAVFVTDTGTPVPPVLKLSSSALRNTYFKTSSSALDITGSRYLFKDFHKQNTVFTIAFWINNANESASTQNILSAITGTTGYGMNIEVLNNEKISIYCCYGSAGNYKFLYSTTATLTAAGGWKYVIIEINDNGATAGSINLGGTTETFTVNNVGSNTLTTTDYKLCAATNSGLKFGGYFDNLLVMNRLMTAQEKIDFIAYNPSRNSDVFIVKERHFDFNDTTKLWTDTAETTNVSANGQSIASITDKTDVNFGQTWKRALQTTAGLRAIYSTNIINGYSCIEFDGVDNTYTMSNFVDRGGAYTWFIVFKNRDVSYGSHILTGSASVYFGVTGDDYVGEFSDPYIYCHHDIGPGLSVTLRLDDRVDNQWNVFALSRVGDQTTIYNTTTKSSITQTDQLRFYTFGGSLAGADWFTDGYFSEVIKYNGYLTDQQIYDKISILKTKYAIS